MPLIAELVNLSQSIVRKDLYLSEEVPDLVTVRRIPAVRQRRVNHQETHDCAEEDVAAEHTRRRDCNNNRQIGKGRIRDHVEEGKPVGTRKAESRNLSKCLHQSHHKTRGDNGRQNRDENIADRL